MNEKGCQSDVTLATTETKRRYYDKTGGVSDKVRSFDVDTKNCEIGGVKARINHKLFNFVRIALSAQRHVSAWPMRLGALKSYDDTEKCRHNTHHKPPLVLGVDIHRLRKR